MTIRFDQALPNLLEWLREYSKRVPPRSRVAVVRDLRAQFRLITDSNEPEPLGQEEEEIINRTLGGYRAPGEFLIHLSAAAGFDSIYGTPDALHLPGLPDNFRFVDRMVTGREWLYPASYSTSDCRRVAFFGLKGGVGRSTSLSMTAWRLAQLEKKVLVIDLDLEAPGLGNVLLPFRKDLVSENDSGVPGWPTCGLVDWFIEDAIGQANEALFKDMVQPSPINGVGRGEVIVVPAAGGAYQQDYISKLSRVYTDFPSANGIETFGDRLLRAVAALEEFVKPDVTLLDSRAGLHHISATVLTRLADTAYLFASDSRQTWAGYDALFSHWALSRDTVRAVRQKLRLVSALTPPSSNKEDWRDSFGEHAFDTFVKLYDEEPQDSSEASTPPEDDDLFSFGVFEDGAPHRPTIVWDSPVYVNFDPLFNTVQLDGEQANGAFSELFDSIEEELNEAGDHES